jgi:ubiquinone/menaquinone biosynthesis C-methylase UbiE
MTRGPSRSHIRKNLALWERQSDAYDRRFRGILGGAKSMAWGVWRIPESRLRLLGDPKGRDFLEIGCGGARWSVALSRRGARTVGIDLSPAQLVHAVRNRKKAKSPLRLVRGDAEQLPFRDTTFDVVFCDWGAMTFCDPAWTVPEAARVLRPGGHLVFATASPFRNLAQHWNVERIGRVLLHDYFGLDRIQYADEVNFQRTYGDWIRLFARNHLAVESLTEPRPGPGIRSRYLTSREEAWARHWPVESIWQTRKEPG